MAMKPFELNRFTDSVASATYEDAVADLRAASSLDDVRALKVAADRQREEALLRGPLLSAACTYLALAQAKTPVGDTDPEEFFHFAANAFRDLGQLQRAAQCYFNSALLGYEKYSTTGSSPTTFAKRSAGRAKSIFADLGEDEQSDNAHVLQQTIKRAEFCDKKNYLLASIFFLWQVISGYGTSPARWARSMFLTVAAFAVLYAILIGTQNAVPSTEIGRNGLAFWTSSLYFSLGNLMQFGTLGSLAPATGLAQFVFMVHAVVAFILIGTGATFLSRR
jgi:hypothetical protein